MKANDLLSRFAMGVYLVIFFGYLLGPLLVMGLTAFNSSAFPSVSPWDCLTFEWFGVLFEDERILNGIKNSVIIGIGTVILSVSIGLAAALVLTQVWPKLRSTYYTVIIAPILIPGVVMGISTLVFWDRVSRHFGLGNEDLFHNGLFLTIMGQSTFIASYCMLVFVARLQRFDPGLSEAALDLGATHTQAFTRILLPFMRPAIASAAVLAFLASFENYNTTTFTFAQYPTLTIELAQKVRYGINPSISALAFIIVILTIFAALANEMMSRNKAKRAQHKILGEPAKTSSVLPEFLRGNPAAIVFVLMSFAAITLFFTSQTYDPAQCKVQVREDKQVEIQKRIKEMQLQRLIKRQSDARQGPDIFLSPRTDQTQGPQPLEQQDEDTSGNSTPGFSIFAPSNLKQDQSDKPSEDEKPASNGAFGGAFDPGNLGQ